MNWLAHSKGDSPAEKRQREKSLGFSGLRGFGRFTLTNSVVNISEWEKTLQCVREKEGSSLLHWLETDLLGANRATACTATR